MWGSAFARLFSLAKSQQPSRSPARDGISRDENAKCNASLEAWRWRRKYLGRIATGAEETLNARERVLWRPGMPSQRCECGAHDKNKNGQRSACGVCVCVCVCVCNGGECWDPRIRGGDRCRVERGAQEENASGSAKPSALSPPSKCPPLLAPHHSLPTFNRDFYSARGIFKFSPKIDAPLESIDRDCLVVISWRREDLWRAPL